LQDIVKNVVVDVRVSVNQAVAQARSTGEFQGKLAADKSVLAQDQEDIPELQGLAKALRSDKVISGIQGRFEGDAKKMLGKSAIGLVG
jgi:hypothetical protein